LGELGLPEFGGLRSEAIRIQVAKRFADPDQRTRTSEAGVRQSPLQVIKSILDEVNHAPPAGDPWMEPLQLPQGSPDGWGIQKSRFTTNGSSPTDALMGAIRQRESRGKYNATNDLGMLGAYQFRAAALADLGLIKRDALEGRTNKAVIDDPKSWTQGYRKAAFLKDKDLQDRIMRKWLRKNLKELRRRGVIGAGSTLSDVAGYLAVAHLAGVGGAVRHKRGLSVAPDKNGTTTANYFDLGRSALEPGEEI
jgi:hypothetical protein